MNERDRSPLRVTRVVYAQIQPSLADDLEIAGDCGPGVAAEAKGRALAFHQPGLAIDHDDPAESRALRVHLQDESVRPLRPVRGARLARPS